MPSVDVLYFGLFNPLQFSPLPIYLPSLIFQQLSMHILISSTFTSCEDKGMWYYCCSIILFSFLSFPKFYRVVTLLKTCSTTEFVYDNVCLCVYVYLWIYLPPMRENMCLLCCWSWLTSLNMMSSHCIHLSSKLMSLFFVAEWYSILYIYHNFIIHHL
jgi:hypothetical protein